MAIPAMEPWNPGRLIVYVSLECGIVFLGIITRYFLSIRTARMSTRSETPADSDGSYPVIAGLKHLILSLDQTVFLSLWTAAGILAMKTGFPPLSIRNQPDLNQMFPIIFLLGALLILHLLHRSHLPFALKGWVMLFMLTSFPLTRPIDHHSLGMVLPLMSVLYTLHRAGPCMERITRIPVLRNGLLLFFVFPMVRLLGSFRGDFGQAVPEILFWLTVFLTILLTAGTAYLFPLQSRSVIRTAVAWHIVVLLLLAILRTFRVAAEWGLSSIVTFRLWLSLLHPNAVGLYLAAAIALLASRTNAQPKNILRITSLISALIMLLLTQSRGALLALVITSFIFLLRAKFLHIKVPVPRPLTVIAALAGLGVTALMISKAGYRLIDASMASDRIALWEAGFKGVLQQPIIGHGPGTKLVLARFVPNDSPKHNEFFHLWLNWDKLGRHFHNIPIEIMWFFGIPGLLLMVAALYYSVRFWRPRSLIWSYPALVLLLGGLVDFPFYYSAVMVLGASLIGSLIGISRAGHSDGEEVSNRKTTLSCRVLPGMLLIIYLLYITPAVSRCYQIARAWIAAAPNPMQQKSGMHSGVIFPSFKLAEKHVDDLLADHHSEEARLFLESYGKTCSGWTGNFLRRLAWLTDNPSRRHEVLSGILEQDPQSLLTSSPFPELFLNSLAGFQNDETEKWFRRSILTDTEFLRQLRQFGTKVPGGIVLNAENVRELLIERGLSPGGFQVGFPEILFDLETHLTRIESELSDAGDVEPNRLEADRRHFFRSILLSRDFIRTTRLQMTWNLKPGTTMNTGDISTFKPGPSDYAILQAAKAIREGSFDEAENYLAMIAGTDRVSAEWHYLSGLVKGAGNRWSEALESFDTALKESPDDKRYLTSKGMALYHCGKKLQALKVLTLVLRHAPWIVNARIYSGMILFESGRFTDAVPHLELVLQLVPDDPWSYYNLYRCLMAIPGNEKRAAQVLQQMEEHFNDASLPAEIRDQIQRRRDHAR